MSVRKSPALPAFSYAQAAKGISPPVSAPQSAAEDKNESAQLDGKSPVTDTASREPTLNKKVDGEAETRRRSIQSVSQAQERTSENRGVDSEGSNASGKELVDIALSSISPDRTESPKAQSHSPDTSSMPKGDDISTATNGTPELQRKDSQASSRADKSGQGKDEKTKDTDDDWEKVSVPSIAPEKELKAAPIPVVNIWQQRKEAQEAKLKANTTQKVPTTSVAPKTKESQPATVSTSRSVGKPKGSNIVDEGDKDRKKPVGQDTRKFPRAVRPNADKDIAAVVAPPPVADAALWPTPENAILEEKRQAPSEKVEKTDDTDTKASAPKKEKWVKVDHVPTVKWEFYNPPTTSRRGGRAARGRDNGGRGAHVNGNERSDKSGTMGPPAIPKPQRQDDRGRSETANESVRSGSIPVQTSRSSSAVTGATDSTKANDAIKPIPNDSMETELKAEPVPDVATAGKAGTNDTSRPRSNSKASTRFTPGSGYKGNNYDFTRAAGYRGDSHAHPRIPGSERRSMPPNFFNQNDIFSGEHGEAKIREYGREKHDSSRETNSTNWRDRDFLNERSERQPRSERGRGGYRGRGNHNNYGSHGSQGPSWTNPLPQHSFPSKSHSYSERHRQSSAPFTGHVQQGQTSRSNPRSQSIPTNGYAGANGIPQQPLSPSHQDFPMFYPMGQNVQYSVDYNMMNTMKLVQAQIEYYFSIENLCKDLFLRKHMDSQGYVLFNFITSFKRLRQLTDDTNIVRETCAQIPTLEYVRGDDGVERLRRREGWGQWILAIDERDDSARNAGPSNVTPAGMNYGYPQIYGQGYTIPSGQDMSLPPWMNGNTQPHFSAPGYGYGRNDYEFHPVSTASNGIPHTPATSEQQSEKFGYPTAGFSDHKANGVMSPTNMESGSTYDNPKLNGVSTNGNETFPNEQIDQLMVVHKDSSVVEDPSIGKANLKEQSEDTAPLPSLRGDADGLEQLGRDGSSQQTSKAGYCLQTSSITGVENDGLMHEPYPQLRERALGQRHHLNFAQDMTILYEFWSCFLINNFNKTMYNEFHVLALEDLNQGSRLGLNCLLLYFQALLASSSPLVEHLSGDIYDTMRVESELLAISIRSLSEKNTMALDSHGVGNVGDHPRGKQQPSLD